jgi:hypothetical protein
VDCTSTTPILLIQFGKYPTMRNAGRKVAFAWFPYEKYGASSRFAIDILPAQNNEDFKGNG